MATPADGRLFPPPHTHTHAPWSVFPQNKILAHCLLVTHVNATHVFSLRAMPQSYPTRYNSRGPRGCLGIDTRGEIGCQTPEGSVGDTGKPWRETMRPGLSVCP